jgi:hypothetical protein
MIKLIKFLLYKNKVLNVPETPIDKRDWLMKEEMISSSKTINSKEFSRSDSTPEVKNQGKIGSCVGHSGRVVYGDTMDFEGKEPSAMWIYKKGKIHDPFEGEDYSGTTIKGACRGLIKEGCCEEKYWPYQDREDTKMVDGAEENAIEYKIKAYYVIPKHQHDLIKKALLTETLWTAFRVNTQFYYTDKNGIVDSEKYLKSAYAGGHAVAMTGWKYVDGNLYWEFQNSWGTSFGKQGFFYVESSLYEKIIMNSIGPIYIETKSEEERKRKEEEERKRKEEERKRKEEEERKRKEEEERKRKEEEERKRKEEEERKRKEEEERKRKEEEERKRKEEEERKRKEEEDLKPSPKDKPKRKKVYLIIGAVITAVLIFLGIDL